MTGYFGQNPLKSLKLGTPVGYDLIGGVLSQEEQYRAEEGRFGGIVIQVVDG